MKRNLKIRLWLVVAAALGGGGLYHAVPFARADEKATAPASNAVLSMDGPGGRVSLGDTVEVAKKAFPPRKGAREREFDDFFADFQREGWGWISNKPKEAFEVSLVDGKIAGMIRAVMLAGERSRTNLVEATVAKMGPPTERVAGKLVTVSVWDAAPKARFLLEIGQWQPGQTMTVAVIGNREELSGLKLKADDLKGMVQQMDVEAAAYAKSEAAKERKKRAAGPGQ